ncbi:MFS transporter [Microbulbifer agarilyticus]|uniref:MFS transporter n=1 Tax=Microbulbifer agarilyticus TaxID=260552 RepID=UPI001C986A86|nr:MFS transporter [Microbulbifer agarilyticus]MBY6190914.1 MFS transporter [Microbulbifer agarilyticus]
MRLFAPVTIIAIAQLLGTSLWFSANGAADDLIASWRVTATDIGWLTNAVQAGFILGTLVLALGGIADRFRASRLFVFSALAGALFNACFAWLSHDINSALVFRFLVGICLAGIYPMGMKLVVSWAPERAGAALAKLVAMLTLGTALPHGLRELGADIPWQWIISASSVLAIVAALLIFRLGDGPHLPISASVKHRSRNKRFATPAVLQAFRIPRFRAAAWGYFGHMWELYAFWTVLPLLIASVGLAEVFPGLGVAGLSFCFIGVGALGCIAGGLLSRRVGSSVVAITALIISGCCVLMFALLWDQLSAVWLVLLFSIWGATVIADSPQFSALSASACPRELVGAALAIQNSIGFGITVVSIAALSRLFEVSGPDAVWLLLPGPVLGVCGFLLTLWHSTEVAAPPNTPASDEKNPR